ncbi:MAG: hypothetical protein JWO82_925, partial [Akkermansiaceae bacterium]|nr:hypothetical protein [Akkermansiaceae bacterium]
MKLTALCIYCGASPGLLPEYSRAAEAAGRILAERGITLVYGGASAGLMGTVADAALSAGGKVIGVMPGHLVEKEIAHPGLTELHAVGSMHERKMRMSELADGFVALPGGIGTFEEIFEAFTWTQLGLHAKPCGLLNVADFYTPLLAFLEHAVEQRFMRAEHYASLKVDTDFS